MQEQCRVNVNIVICVAIVILGLFLIDLKIDRKMERQQSRIDKLHKLFIQSMREKE